MTVAVYDGRICALGEGSLWHPVRKQLFWFDILGRKLLSQTGDQALEWAFETHVSAAGWVNDAQLLIASEVALFLFDVETGKSEPVADLEAENSVTRSNDGRADPYGGFWIGTMGKSSEPRAGAIYRYYRGEVRRLFSDITISNAICFAPDGDWAYFCDTTNRLIQRQALDGQGWPKGAPEVFVDLRTEGLNPDGAVVDAEGNLWNAQWGVSRVACYDPAGAFVRAIEYPASQISCPAFGGDDLRTLFVTSAAVGVAGDADGQVFATVQVARGQAEHRVIL